jgi:hypothetical protein
MLYILLLIVLIMLIVYFYLLYYTDIFKYRLGDAILYDEYYHNNINKKWYNFWFKNSIATEYWNRSKNHNDLETLYNIIQKRSKNITKAAEDTLIIHLRLGDVIDHLSKENVDDLLNKDLNNRYINNYKYFDKYINNEKIKKIILVAGYHVPGKMKKSEEYIEKIKIFLENKGYQVDTRINKYSADEDFLYMCKSKYFLKSKGMYSKLINEMVKKNGNQTLCNQ